MNIHVSNLGAQITDDSLHATFSAYGEVSQVTIMMDQFTGKSRGFAHINMPVVEEAITAIEKLNGAIVNGSALQVKEGEAVKVLAGSYPVGRR